VIEVPGGGVLVEVEQQGAGDELAPGATSVWGVHWLVREPPPEVVLASGQTALVERARGLAASVRGR